MSRTVTRQSLRQLAEEAYRGFERERIESWRRKSEHLLDKRLRESFCLEDFEILHRPDGTAYAIIDGFEFQPPDNVTNPGLLIWANDRFTQIHGLVDLGRFFAAMEDGE